MSSEANWKIRVKFLLRIGEFWSKRMNFVLKHSKSMLKVEFRPNLICLFVHFCNIRLELETVFLSSDQRLNYIRNCMLKQL